jgi:hypothetical protein
VSATPKVRLRVWLPRAELPRLEIVLHQVAKRGAYVTWARSPDQDPRSGVGSASRRRESDPTPAWAAGGLLHLITGHEPSYGDESGGFRASVRETGGCEGEHVPDAVVAALGPASVCVVLTANQSASDRDRHGLRIFAESLAYAGDGVLEEEDGRAVAWQAFEPPPPPSLLRRILRWL